MYCWGSRSPTLIDMDKTPEVMLKDMATKLGIVIEGEGQDHWILCNHVLHRLCEYKSLKPNYKL